VALDTTALVWYIRLMSDKKKTTMLLTPEAKQLLEALAKKYGISQTALLEMILRDRARQEGLWQ
jgi:hypothetical protein